MTTITPGILDSNAAPFSSLAAGEWFLWVDPNDPNKLQTRMATLPTGTFVRITDGATGTMDGAAVVFPVNAAVTLSHVEAPT